jgi:2-oxoglutarate ferredoxin oxidoreductase subunit gamma
MTETGVVMAGFGGQGMLLSGKLLAHAAMSQGLEVSWLPSYGPEMRGGTANVIVCISSKRVASPYVVHPNALLVMNQPSLEKFGPRVRPGGLIIVNSSLVPVKCDRGDCSVLHIAANDIAAASGAGRAVNLVMLGAYVGMSGVVEPQSVEEAIMEEFREKPKFVPSNEAAFRAGLAEGLKAGRAREGR